ncbi:hypothetical protein V5P93_003618 [Actinokineospora auranticolor]|uniref:DUF1444 family protein n=1 Tax=Actinokineospora auranticolor TaxID=155976 RepID=A0A2S6GJ49_9PSEU|nr:hypothetical protein [Actinokineospora auranticolor]PPK65181.1 hypothetical protein CLV40_11528 [Actinokineospora auranticolor]
MNNDVTVNVIVFQLREGEPALANVPTQADDAVRLAWAHVSTERGITPADVTAVYSEWQPSDEDNAFVAATFPGVQQTYSFARPAPDGWEAAFTEARRVMVEAARQQAQETGEELLPLVWSTAATGSSLLESLPHLQLVPGQLAVTLGRVGMTERGTVGVHYLTAKEHEDMGAPPLADLLAQAGDNLKRGLRMEVHESDRGDLLSMTRATWLASSAIALDDFHARLSRQLGTDRIVVGMPNPDQLLIAAAESGWLDAIREEVMKSEHANGQFLPAVLLVDSQGMQVLIEQTA